MTATRPSRILRLRAKVALAQADFHPLPVTTLAVRLDTSPRRIRELPTRFPDLFHITTREGRKCLAIYR